MELIRHYIEWEENIRMDFKEIGVNMTNWVDSAEDRFIGEPL